jgi:uncharacterized protein YegL
MRKGHTELICILDRSGSMHSIKEDAIGGFNSFLESQRNVPGTASVTLVLFDDVYEKIYNNVDLSVVNNLTEETFQPRGTTALLDAIGKTINSVGERLNNTAENDRPEKVMICILTDGYENCSHEFTKERISEMISHQRNVYSWEFAFLAANQDAFTTADSLNISKQYTSNFVATGDGTQQVFRDLNLYASSYRSN